MNTITEPVTNCYATVDFDDTPLQAMLRIAAKADPTRPHLQTINFDRTDDGEIYAAATDSYVMIRAKLPALIDSTEFDRLSYSCDGLKQSDMKNLGAGDLLYDKATNNLGLELLRAACHINHASLFPATPPTYKASVPVKDVEKALRKVRVSKHDDTVGLVFERGSDSLTIGLPAPGKMNVSLKKLQSVLAAFKNCYTVSFEAQEDLLRPLVLSNETHGVQGLIMPVRVRDDHDFSVTIR